MTTQQAVERGIPRWMVLSHLKEDVEQIVALVDLVYHTPGQRRAALAYELRRLRKTQWERTPSRSARKPKSLRPSKLSSGYRTNSDAHRLTRLQMEPSKRAEIARKGAQKRWRAN